MKKTASMVQVVIHALIYFECMDFYRLFFLNYITIHLHRSKIIGLVARECLIFDPMDIGQCQPIKIMQQIERKKTE